jgi:hypothetical protein
MHSHSISQLCTNFAVWTDNGQGVNMKLSLVLAIVLLVGPTQRASAQDYDDGKERAEENDILGFDNDCQHHLGTDDAENGCNVYVQESDTGFRSFHGYGCAEDCSGHEAGYAWAMENGITNPLECVGNSQAFLEGCWAYSEEN